MRFILWVIFIIGLMLVFRISMAQLLLAFKGLGAQIHQLVITSANTAPVQEENGVDLRGRLLPPRVMGIIQNLVKGNSPVRSSNRSPLRRFQPSRLSIPWMTGKRRFPSQSR